MMRGIILILLSLWAATGIAKNPWYAGAGFGVTNYREGSTGWQDPVTNDQISFDNWESGYKLLGGYQLNDQWAVEAGYTDFGKTDGVDPDFQIIGVAYEYEIAGIYLNGQYHIPLNDSISVDVVGGWLFAEADRSLAGLGDTTNPPSTDSFDDNGLQLGLAFTWFANQSFFVRGTVDYYMIDFDDTLKKPWRLGVDLIWDF